MHWRKVAILGVGLLGGSLGLALRRRGLAGEVSGYVRRLMTVGEGMAVGALDGGSMQLAEVVPGADLVVLCTPVSRMPALAAELRGHLQPGALVTDVGSVKGSVIAAVEKAIADSGGYFVGSHPMAGSERTGVSAAREDLFQGALTVMTPTPASDGEAVSRIRALWESIGSRVVRMSAEEHDRLVSRSSHLPHFVAAALAQYILDPGHPEQQAMLCATGFRDTTRVASGSPEMWRDIALGNREAILEALSGFEAALGSLRSAIEGRDGPALERWLRSAKQRRDAWKGNGGRAGAE